MFRCVGCANTWIPGDPDYQLLQSAMAVGTHLTRIQAATEEMRGLRDRLDPIYVYYFPKRWRTVLLRALRLTPLPDFGRFRGEISEIASAATQAITRADEAITSLTGLQAPSDVLEFAQVARRQVFLDGSFITSFARFIIALDVGDPIAGRASSDMRQFSKRAHENLASLQRAFSRVQSTK